MPNLASGFTLSDDPSKLQIDVIHAYLSRSYWAEGIPRNVVEDSVANSFCVGIYRQDEQVAFARLVTDYATFAYLADVFVLPGHEGKGLASAMLDYFQTHARFSGLRRWLLVTRDAHPLYERHGWKRYDDEMSFMTMARVFPDAYLRRDFPRN